MKTLKIFSIVIACLMIASSVFAQKEKTESFKVAGECKMCKKKIEKAAKEAGASFASWSPETKILKVSYNVNTSNAGSIQQAIANVGYDTPKYKATEEAYKSLDECCQYERDKATAKCCDGEKCEKKDGECAKAAVCKEKGCGDMSCCKKS
ncbi:MAG: ATPase [Bacteroidetes bacterium]|nr:ATPase [Bacteroidota bacterium]MBS1607234.1 ATPase [Bacteroidota bacterium]